MKPLSQQLNFNTLLIAAVGCLATYCWSDIRGKLDAVPALVTKVAVIDERVETLQKNCVTEARINDLLARARAPKANSPRAAD